MPDAVRRRGRSVRELDDAVAALAAVSVDGARDRPTDAVSEALASAPRGGCETVDASLQQSRVDS